MAVEAAPDTSDDAVLGGRLVLRQPKKGHRFGHDAILLAAATTSRSGDHAVELGAGVGAAGLALAHRVAGLRLTLVEIDAALAALAQENAGRNGLAERVRVLALDVANAAQFADAKIEAGSVQHVLMNPPFNDATRQKLSPDASRRFAHAGSPEMLAQWVKRAAWLLAPSGALTLIWRADGLADVRGALEADFGDVAVLPVFPRPHAEAIRVLVRATKGSRGPVTHVPGLTLNDANGKPSAAAEAILRAGAALQWADAAPIS